jgi:nitrate/nitrite transporter NarK
MLDSQLPCNILLRHFGARNWISFIVVSWGIVQLAMGFVSTWGFLALCRIFLGAFEVLFAAIGRELD